MFQHGIFKIIFLGFLQAHSRKYLLLIYFVVLDESKIIDEMIIFLFLLKYFTPNLFPSTPNLTFSSNGLKQGRVLLNAVKKKQQKQKTRKPRIMYISLSVSCESLKLIDWQKHALIGMLLRGYSTCENSNCRVIDLPIVFTSEFYLCSPVFFSSLLSSHHPLLKYLVALLHTSTIILICIYSFRQPQRKQDPFLRTLFLMEQYQRFHTLYNQWPHGMILFEQSYHLLFMTYDQLNKIGLKTRTGPWKLVLC